MIKLHSEKGQRIMELVGGRGTLRCRVFSSEAEGIFVYFEDESPRHKNAVKNQVLFRMESREVLDIFVQELIKVQENLDKESEEKKL